jgi:hypothetical protein
MTDDHRAAGHGSPAGPRPGAADGATSPDPRADADGIALAAIDAADLAHLAGKRVRVHYHLRRHDWSVVDRSTGRVAANVANITLADVDFKVQPKGLERIRSRGQREVIAYALGTIAAVNEPAPRERRPNEITFNPYRADTFTRRDGTPVHHADLVTFAPDDNGFGKGWTT